MNSDRIKEIQMKTAYPESVSVKQALLQVWNECEQEKVKLALDTIKPSKMPCGNCDVEQSVMYCEKCWDIANNS
jgi:hypothetical protein